MKKVDKYLLISTKQRQLSLEHAAALRIQTAFRAFLVNMLPKTSADFYLPPQYALLHINVCGNGVSAGTKGIASIERTGQAPGTSAGSHCPPSSSHHPEVHASFGSSASSDPGSASEDVDTGFSCATHHHRTQMSSCNS